MKKTKKEEEEEEDFQWMTKGKRDFTTERLVAAQRGQNREKR